MPIQKRAKRGGEHGINGEFYEGGKFLPSTTLPKRAAVPRVRGTGRVLVEPGVLAVPPEGKLAIFNSVREFVSGENGQLSVRREPDHPAHTYYFADGYAELKALVDRYNNGERYY